MYIYIIVYSLIFAFLWNFQLWAFKSYLNETIKSRGEMPRYHNDYFSINVVL